MSAVVLLVVGAPSTTFAATPAVIDGDVCPSTFPITVNAATLNVRYCASQPLTTADPAITRVAFVVHGVNRNAVDYYNSMVDAATQDGAMGATLVVAPQFLSSADVTGYSLPTDTMFWKGGWSQGDRSPVDDPTNPRPFRYSSFSVMDDMIAAVATHTRFPNLRDIVVAGHSAGGQFTQRYAAGTRLPQTLVAPGNHYRFVVANPSSYLYLDDRRPVAGTDGTYAIPTTAQRQTCPTFNDYKYGLSNLSGTSYMNAVGAPAIRTQYAARDVRYLLGALDTDLADPNLDTGCEATHQGVNRRARGESYFGYLGAYYGAAVYDTHHLALVAGVAHDAQAMFTSTTGRAAVFGS